MVSIKGFLPWNIFPRRVVGKKMMMLKISIYLTNIVSCFKMKTSLQSSQINSFFFRMLFFWDRIKPFFIFYTLPWNWFWWSCSFFIANLNRITWLQCAYWLCSFSSSTTLKLHAQGLREDLRTNHWRNQITKYLLTNPFSNIIRTFSRHNNHCNHFLYYCYGTRPTREK